MKPKTFTEATKKQAVSEYHSGKYTKGEIEAKYDIQGHSTFSKWLAQYSSMEDKKLSSIVGDFQQVPSKDELFEENARLKAELIKSEMIIAEQKKEISEYQDAVLGYKTLIYVAEKNLKIDLKKNFGTKRLAT